MGTNSNINMSEIEVKLLTKQREQLIEGINKTNETFHNTIFTLITAIVSLIAANIFANNLPQIEIISLILIQLIILIIIYITIQLVNGNLQRYYVCAIDDYLYAHYKITCLFYEGSTSRMHVMGKRATLPFMTRSITFIIIAVVMWIVYELDVYSYMIENIGFTMLVILEGVILLWIVAINFKNKFQNPKEYTECLVYLNRDEEKEEECG
ncbi:MAG: hypothetical protein IJZ23_00725 [Roseburia sp.]|nr:hypothetical protein [Roseburia sp.]